MPLETPPVAAPPAPAPVVPAAPAPNPPVASPPIPLADGEVKIPLSQLQAYQADQRKLIDLQDKHERDAKDAKQKLAELELEKGNIQTGMNQIRAHQAEEEKKLKDTIAQEQERARKYATDRELTAALAEHQLMPGATEQLSRLFKPELQAVSEGESIIVRTPTHQTAKEFVAAMLSKKEYEHFVRAGSQPGTGGSQGAHHDSPTPPASPTPEIDVSKLNFGQALILAGQQEIKNKQAAGAAPASADMSQYFGIRPKR